MKYYLSLVGFFISLAVLVGGSPTATAQSSNDIRIQFGAYYPDGDVLIQIAVPRGQTIESASLTLQNGQTIELRSEPQSLAIKQWLIFDASDSMMNAASRISAAAERFTQGTENRRTGLITFDDAVKIYHPTPQRSELRTFLSEYSARANSPGCLGDALTTYSEQAQDTDEAVHILLVAGPLSRQGPCLASPLQTLNSPIDIIVIADEIDAIYQDIADLSGGSTFQANLLTIENRFEEVRTLWARPVYALRGNFSEGLTDRGTVRLRLQNGRQIEGIVRLTALDRPVSAIESSGFSIAAVSTPLPTASPTHTPTPIQPSTANLLTVQATIPYTPDSDIDEAGGSIEMDRGFVPDLPTVPPSLSSNNPVDLPTPEIALENPTIASIVEQSSPNPENGFRMAEDEPAQPNAEVLEAVAAEDTSSPALADTDPNPTESAPLPPVEVANAENSIIEAEAETEGQNADSASSIVEMDSSEGFNTGMLLGVGLLGAAMVLGLGFFFYERRPKARPYDEGDMVEHTVVYQEDSPTPEGDYEHFYSPSPTPDANANWTVPVAYDDLPSRVGGADDDDIMLTELMEDEGGKPALLNNNSPEGIKEGAKASLRLEGAKPQTYEILASGLTIGRKSSCDISLPNEAVISGEHIRLEWRTHELWLHVLSRINGVIVSGLVVNAGQSRRLEHQDNIQLSPNTRLTVIFAESPLEDEDDDDDLTII